MKKFPKLVDADLPKATEDGGSFVLRVDDKGRRYWRGGCFPEDKEATSFAPGESLELAPERWPPGTVISALVPASDDEDEWAETDSSSACACYTCRAQEGTDLVAAELEKTKVELAKVAAERDAAVRTYEVLRAELDAVPWQVWGPYALKTTGEK